MKANHIHHRKRLLIDQAVTKKKTKNTHLFVKMTRKRNYLFLGNEKLQNKKAFDNLLEKNRKQYRLYPSQWPFHKAFKIVLD